MVADFWFYYRLDLAVVLKEATMPPAHLLALIERLPEGSMTTSMRHDKLHWRDYFGADKDYYVLAGIYDAVNINTRATGNWAKGKAPQIDPWPVPQVAASFRQKAEARKPRTVADLYGQVKAHQQQMKG